MSRNGWLGVAGVCGLAALCVGWGDTGSIIMGRPAINLIATVIFTLIACYAVFKAGAD